MTRPKQPPSSNTHETAISIHRQLHAQSPFLVTPTTTTTMTTAFSLQTFTAYQENLYNLHDGPATFISFQSNPFMRNEKFELKFVDFIIVRVFISLYGLNLVGVHNRERWILVGTVDQRVDNQTQGLHCKMLDNQLDEKSHDFLFIYWILLKFD